MKIQLLGRLLFPVLSTGLILLGTAQLAVGAVISTEGAIRLEDRASMVDRVNAALAADQVSSKLVALGVSPTDAQQRVAALSDSELQLLDQRIADLPAGADGVLTVLGIVLLVLLVLELVGVTDIFKSF
jgi:Family of unknown function (DUF6627)